MHTSRALTGVDFELTVAARPATLEDVLDGFTELDRLGIVIAQDGGAAGASTLVLAAVTGFYDRLRMTGEDFFAYPDFFAFHLGARRGSLRKLDVFPEHKEVVITGPLQELMRAINDRGITRLVVPDRRPGLPELDRDTRASAHRRIRTAIAYSAAGRVPGADISITAPAIAEEFVTAMLGRAGPDRGALRDPRGRPRETFRRLSVDEALAMLATEAQ